MSPTQHIVSMMTYKQLLQAQIRHFTGSHRRQHLIENSYLFQWLNMMDVNEGVWVCVCVCVCVCLCCFSPEE